MEKQTETPSVVWQAVCWLDLTKVYLDVPCSLLGLVGHPLLDAGQLLLEVGHLVLVKLCQVIELVLQTLVPVGRRMEESEVLG